MEQGNGTLYVKRKSGKIKELKPHQWLIDLNTGVGEDADLYEVRPYGGRKLIDRRDIVEWADRPKEEK